MTELWKDVQGYEGLYKVSNLGNVYSCKRNKLLKKYFPDLGLGATGYNLVGLYKDGKQKMFVVHRLVAQAFIDNPLNLPVVNHKDGNKRNNTVENLEWCTQKENVAHAIAMGVHGKIRRKREREAYQRKTCGY